MALKALMLAKELKMKRQALDALKEEAEKLTIREKDLEAAIEEAASEDDQKVIEEAVEAFNADKAANEEQTGILEREIQELESALAKEEAEQETEQNPQEEHKDERKDERKMENRTNFFGMTMQERDMFIARDDVQALLQEVRSAIKEKRQITGVGYLIPQVILGLLRENVMEYSKLYKHVYVRRIRGEGRMVIEGQIPEAVWTEMCANLNELDLSFDKVEIDGYKVGGYFRMCNAMLEDSDIDLAAELIRVLGQAIGYALDKAILYGTGTKMPTGVMTALTGTANIVSIAAGTTGTDLIKAIVTDAALAKSKYSRGAKVWVMNETTYTKIVSESLTVNAAGALVAGVNGTMPVIGGVIEVLNFIPDNVIIGGFFDLYLLVERAGTRISTSEHAFWVEDQTGFKGTARYDGKVLYNLGFVAIGLEGTTPAAGDVEFAQDTANSGSGA